MPRLPKLSPCDRVRIFMLMTTALLAAAAYARHRPDKLVGLALLLVIGWRGVDKLESSGLV